MDIQTKDGIILRNVPDGTPDDVIKARLAQIRGQSVTPQTPSAPADETPSIPQTLAIGAGRGLDKLAMGLKQGVYGGGAVLSELLPSGMKKRAQDYLTNELMATERQQADFDRNYAPLQKARPFATGFGEALPLMASPMLKVMQGPGLLSAGVNAAASAALPAMASYGSAEDRAKNAGISALAGGVGGAAISGLSRVVSPQVSPNVSLLQKEGVRMTPGQLMGGNFARLEEKLTSAPILGDAISMARNRANDDLNKAVLNRGLGKIGESVDDIGRDGVSMAADKISGRYNDLLPKLNVKIDNQFLSDITAAATSKTPQVNKEFASIIEDTVTNRFNPNGGMAGKTMKEAEAQLGYYIRQYGISQNPDQRMLGDALKEAQSALRDMVMRSNPTKAGELKAINSAFANQVIAERAAGAVGSKGGVFSPERLSGAVKASNSSVRKNQFAKGNALMQDLSDAAVDVLGRNVPDSGTAGRLANIAALGSAAITPGPLMALGGASLAYTPQVQKLIEALLTQRPEMAGLLGRELQRLAPRAGVPSGLLAASMYE